MRHLWLLVEDALEVASDLRCQQVKSHLAYLFNHFGAECVALCGQLSPIAAKIRYHMPKYGWVLVNRDRRGAISLQALRHYSIEPTAGDLANRAQLSRDLVSTS